jgi:hypothetical protein
MSRISSSILTALLALPAGDTFACDSLAQHGKQALLERFPNSIESDKRGTLDFCPDNTCVRVRSARASVDLEPWLLAYLFHFGGYYALADWRADIGSAESIQGYPAALKVCTSQPDPVSCRKTAFGNAKVSVVEVRYDEGVVSETEASFDPVAAVPASQ